MPPNQHTTVSLIPSQLHYNPRNPSLTVSPTTPSFSPDNIRFGDSLLEKHQQHFRLILQNPNGLSYENDLFSYQVCLNNMKSVSADIVLLTETNLQWTHPTVLLMSNCHRKRIFDFSIQTTSNSQRNYNSPYQPGGTCSILIDKLVGRHLTSTTDLILGRWNITTLNTRNNHKLSIVCCYQVCQQSPDHAGPKTAYSQQWSLLKEQGVAYPDPRKQFYKDLDKTLTSLAQQDHTIILAGDFNNSLGDDPHGLDKIVYKFNLTDAIQHLHGPSSLPSYNRGKKCIDYIFCSRSFLPAIQRGAILPFYSITTSDHRPIFIDIDISRTFQSPLSSLIRPSQRSLSSTNPSNCAKYIAKIHSSFQHHRIFHRIKQLESIKSLHAPNAIELLEAIDRDVTRLMLSSEKHLIKPSPAPFSSKLEQACLHVSLLKLKYSELKHNKPHSSHINRLQQHLRKPFQIPNDIATTQTKLRQARSTVRTLRKQAVALREEFLLSKESNKDTSTIIKRIRRAEEIKRGYAKLRHLLRPSTSSLVTTLEVPSDSTPPKQATSWTRITDPQTVTQRLIDRNTTHFGAAHGTPFTVPPLSSDLDWSATSPVHKDILQGSFSPYNDPLTNRLLHRLKQRVSPGQPTITMHELIKRLRRWKESTTTSPSRRHLGHYKSLLPPPSYNLTEYLELPEGQILSVHLAILNFCARTGYSLQRWHKIVTMVIPKQHNNFKIHRLRVIHLYEADLTALFSIWSRKMILNATANNTLNPGSYGARPGRTSIDPAFISVLQHEISNITRTNLVLAPNDAAQCYDRIVPNHAMLSCMSHGMPPSAASCIGTTLLKAKYYLRTALNESSSYWSHTPSTPIYGTGQGSGISPGICCATFSDLFDVHSSISCGSVYKSPTTRNTTTLHNVGFVDDTTTTICDHSLPRPLTPQQLLTTIQSDLQNWSNLLHLSGGALEHSKTELFLLHWKFNDDGIPYLSSSDNLSITLTSPDTNHQHTIHSSSPHTSYKLLGFHLSPSLSTDRQYNELLTKSHRIANAIAGSSVTRREAFLAYFAIYHPSISYFLVLTSLTQKQCHHIQSRPTMIFLQRCGLPSTMHRSIVYGPRRLGGLGFRDIYTTQGIAHTIKIIQTIRTPGQPCDLLRLLLEEWQIHSGSSHPLLEYPKHPCIHLEGSWLTSTRTFLATIDGSLSITDLYCPTSNIPHDIALMDSFHSLSGIGRKRMQQLNRCRIFLQVHFLSELLTPDGLSLQPGFWTGTSTNRPATPLHKYPRQSTPAPRIWAFWRATIRRLFCCPRRCTLRIPLTTLPHTSKYYTSRRSSPSPSSRVPPWQQQLLSHVHYNTSSSLLLHCIFTSLSTSSILAASDGSASHLSATFGWTISSHNKPIVTNYGPVHGYQPTAFRAEATGLLSLLVFLLCLLTKYHWITLPHAMSLPIYLDNQSLLHTVISAPSQKYSSPSEATSSEQDLIMQIIDTIAKLPLSLSFFHVKSHQDKHIPIHQLSYPAQANCTADQLATHARSHCTSLQRTPLYPAAICRLCILDVTLTRSFTHALFYHSTQSQLKQYILSSRSWTDTNIDWSILKSVSLRQSHNLPFFLKWIHRMLPVGVLIHRRDPTASPFCPACGCVETQLHFITCTHPSRLFLKRQLITQLRSSLSSIVTDPTLKSIFLFHIDHLITNLPLHPPSFPQPYHFLLHTQASLGWDNLLRGFLSPEWSYLHTQYLNLQSDDINYSTTHPFLPVILELISHIQSMWKFRSDQRHSKSIAHQETELLRQAKQQITSLYQLRSLVLPTDKHIFHTSLQEHLRDDLPSLQAWLINHAHYIQESVKHAQHLHVTHTNQISHYFSTAP